MGGQINMAFRFSDGEACCFDRWTNNMGILSNLDILDGDEQPVRDYIAMCRNNDFTVDPYFTGKPVRVTTSGYGLVLIDYVTQTIIDCNGYSSLFGSIPAFSIREGSKDDWHARDYTLIRTALEAGRGVFEHQLKSAGKTTTRLTGIEALADILDKAKADRSFETRDDFQYLYDIDTSPWTYHHLLEAERSTALKIARDIGFPMTRKEGLNANYPAPKVNKNASKDEVKARYLWMQLKSATDRYKEYDGMPWERLSSEAQTELLTLSAGIPDEAYEKARLGDFLSATTFTVNMKIEA